MLRLRNNDAPLYIFQTVFRNKRGRYPPGFDFAHMSSHNCMQNRLTYADQLRMHINTGPVVCANSLVDCLCVL